MNGARRSHTDLDLPSARAACRPSRGILAAARRQTFLARRHRGRRRNTPRINEHSGAGRPAPVLANRRSRPANALRPGLSALQVRAVVAGATSRVIKAGRALVPGRAALGRSFSAAWLASRSPSDRARRASSCSIATQWYIVAASPGRRSSRLIAQRDTRYSSFYAGVSSHGHRTSPTISTRGQADR